jgi:hypothetical protein
MKSLRKIPFRQVLGFVLGAVAGAACLAVLTFSPVGQTGTQTAQVGGVGGGHGEGALPGTATRQLKGADLVSYTSCSALLAQVKSQALQEVGPYGLSAGLFPDSAYGAYGAGGYPVYGGYGVQRGLVPLAANALAAGAAAAAAPSSTASTAGTEGTQDFSTTNDQEAGVDEPDMVKTDGQLMVVLRQQPLGVQVVDVSGATPSLEGFLALPQLAEADGLFLVDQYAVVIGTLASTPEPGPVGYGASGTSGVPVAPGAPGASGVASVPVATSVGPVVRPKGVPAVPAPVGLHPVLFRPVEPVEQSTDVVVISLVDPGQPSIVRTFGLQGTEEGARLINGQVVLVLEHQPAFRWFYPVAAGAAAQKTAELANRALIEGSAISDWLPSVTVFASSAGGKRVSESRTAACGSTYHTAMPSGVGTVSVVSLDPATSSPGSEVTVVGNAEDVYASATDVYVATTSWRDQLAPGGTTGGSGTTGGAIACPMNAMCLPRPVFPLDLSTDIYGFDISGPGAPEYLGSGSVPGTLIGQYAMSEYDGYLRVASTLGEPTPAPVDGGQAPAQLSDNMVSVLQPDSGALVTVGSLHGLGEGEKIYSVRFVGDLGYVVTFNQTDPLYVVDLSDPTQPVLAGQLALSGYSSFLQPLSTGLLLGVGESVDQDLRTEGLQLEVFNVSDASQPSLVSSQQLGTGASSAAEYDPHALLWWAPAGLVVLPVDDYSGAQPSSAADVWSVSASGALSDVGSVSQPGGGQPGGSPDIERAVVVGNNLYTLSEQGVLASDLSSLSQVAWLPYGASS